MLKFLHDFREQQDHFIREQSKLHVSVQGVAETLNQLAKSHERLEMSSQNQSAEVRKSIISSLRDFLQGNETDLPTSTIETVPNSFPRSLQNDLINLVSESRSLQRQVKIIESLQFPEIADREENIKVALPGTFEWLFRSEGASENHPDLLKWLRTGEGIFWVSGKAGSGKSTLMKFFHHHNKTHTALQEWAADRRLLVATFFFWNAGTKMQKSQHGLLQTLLCHIFRKAPELMMTTCPSRWEQVSHHSYGPWKYEEVCQAFGRLKQQQIDSVRFCFFIDGLDEYDGDHIDVIQTMNDLTCTGAVKICFSSRPWNVFKTAYGKQRGRKISLQDLTRDDIRQFVEESFALEETCLILQDRKDGYENIIEEIVDRSNGVFLWVYLVVRSLRRGMTNLDTTGELQERLHELPTSLETFFQHIFDKTEKIYRRQAARLYRICLVSKVQVTALDVAWFAEQDPYFGLSENVLARSCGNHDALEQTTATRVMARCQDLLEFASFDLQFLHRTVKDFLNTRDMSTQLEVRSGKDFNPYNFLCNSTLFQFKLKIHLSDDLGCKQAFLDAAEVQKLVDGFILHATHLENCDELNPELVAELAKVIWLYFSEDGKILTEEEIRNYHMKIVGNKVFKYGSIQEFVQWTPLDIAFSHINDEEMRLETRRILREGFDPNQECPDLRSKSPWTRYLDPWIQMDDWLWIKSVKGNIDIIREFLLHGAEAKVLHDHVMARFGKARQVVAQELYQDILPEEMRQQPQQRHSPSTWHKLLSKRKRRLDEHPDFQLEQNGHVKRGRYSIEEESWQLDTVTAASSPSNVAESSSGEDSTISQRPRKRAGSHDSMDVANETVALRFLGPRG